MTLKNLLLKNSFFRVILILWLISTDFVVLLLGRVDWIVHHQLYDYGLQFNLDWAAGYWAVVRLIYIFLAVPTVLSSVVLGLEVWHEFRGKKVAAVERSKLVGRSAEAAKGNHMLISCPKCKRVFSKPLVMLDFSDGKTRLVNVCPYCSHVLGSADNSEVEKGEDDGVKFVGLDRREVEQK